MQLILKNIFFKIFRIVNNLNYFIRLLINTTYLGILSYYLIPFFAAGGGYGIGLFSFFAFTLWGINSIILVLLFFAGYSDFQNDTLTSDNNIFSIIYLLLFFAFCFVALLSPLFIIFQIPILFFNSEIFYHDTTSLKFKNDKINFLYYIIGLILSLILITGFILFWGYFIFSIHKH